MRGAVWQLYDFLTSNLLSPHLKAIIKAISKQQQVDMKEAERIFNYHSTEQMRQNL